MKPRLEPAYGSHGIPLNAPSGPDSDHAVRMHHLFPREIGRENYLLRWIILAGAAFDLLIAAKRIDGFDVSATILVCTLLGAAFPLLGDSADSKHRLVAVTLP